MLGRISFIILVCLLICSISCVPTHTQEKTNDKKLLIAPICLDGKSAYINKSGDVVLKTTFDFDGAQYFSDGLARFKENGKYGFIDETGKIVIKASFDSVEPFFEGFAQFHIDDKAGFIDKTGKIVVQPIYDRVHNFANGFALIGVEKGVDEFDLPTYKIGFIDKTGEIVIGRTENKKTGRFDDGDDFSEGLFPVKIRDKWGYIDKKENTVIKFQFETAKPFSEGLAPATLDGEKWGFIDKSGKFVIQPRFTDADIFSGGLAAVSTHFNSFITTEFIDKSGNTVFKTPDTILSGRFFDGVTTISLVDKINGNSIEQLIDRKGEVIIQKKNVGMITLRGGVTLFGTPFGTSYVDKMGKYIWNSEKQDAKTLSKCRELESANSYNILETS